MQIAIFKREQADSAIDRLLQLGVPESEISALQRMPEGYVDRHGEVHDDINVAPQDERYPSGDTLTPSENRELMNTTDISGGLATGAAKGALTGGAIGAIGGLALMLIPGTQVLGAGLLAATLFGASGGAALGATQGAADDLERAARERARTRMTEAIELGETVISVPNTYLAQMQEAVAQYHGEVVDHEIHI